MTTASPSGWQPHDKLTTPPTNLKEAIDWVLRVTGKDGKKNAATTQSSPASTSNGPHCLCYLAKAVKDLLYDAKDPGTPGPSPKRNWDDILLDQEQSIAQPVLQDLGLLSDGSTGAASSTCGGGTEVIKALIDQLAQGLQKWVGWQETGDECCLKGAEGIGKKCDCRGGVGGTCCTGSGTSSTPCHQCSQCGTTSASKKCYLSAYCKTKSSSSSGTTEHFLWTSISSDSTRVHLLARIFLGSVCLIWSGLSQLGWLTKGGSGGMWETSELSKITGNGKDGLGSFMAAMGYDLDRLNGSGGGNKDGTFVWKLLSGEEPSDKKNQISWQEFASVKGKLGDSVAEYYSEIYKNAKEATLKTEQLCEQYPLLVLHILASGYFRAGSAGAKGIIPAPKAPSSDPRKPRTIREILYWLSALPYSQGYKALVERMQQKTDQVNKGGNISLEGDGVDKKTDLHKDKITHYLMAACGYCPLILIVIQGTINTSGTDSDPSAAGPGGVAAAGADDKRCPEHKKDPSAKRCTLEEATQTTDNTKTTTNGKLQKGQVCYGGYHLAVKDFGPLHGMYANGLFGFQMDGSPAQCLDQLRVYVYHCFYQLYFLRKQCGVGVVDGAGAAGKTVLGWQSCRYGSGVYWGSGYSQSNLWRCQAEGSSGGGDHTKKCGIPSSAGGNTTGTQISPLMCFLCDGVDGLVCNRTKGSSVNNYPEIEDHINCPAGTVGHFGKPPKHCPVPMGWQSESGAGKDNHFKDLNTGSHKTQQLTGGTGSPAQKYPAHCTGNTLSHLLEYYCDPEKQHGTLVLVLRLLACITPTVPRTLGDLFGFYYYIVYIGGNKGVGEGVYQKLQSELQDVRLDMLGGGSDVVEALTTWSSSGDCNTKNDTLKCLYGDGKGTGQCSPYLCPLSGQQYGQLSPAMAGTYLSWLVYLIEGFKTGLEGLAKDYRDIVCRDNCSSGAAGAGGCGGKGCGIGTHGTTCSGAADGVCKCPSVVSCTGVLPVLYKYGFGYGNVTELHPAVGPHKQCHDFLSTLERVLGSDQLVSTGKGLHHEINQLIYTTRLPWIFVLTVAWLVAVLYLAFGAIWPLDWTHMRSHCRGWFRKGSLSPWEVLMVGKKKGRGILEYFGKT